MLHCSIAQIGEVMVLSGIFVAPPLDVNHMTFHLWIGALFA
jgi:hypothetical protein